MKVFVSLAGVSEEKWHDMSQSERKAYLKKHPHSKYADPKRKKEGVRVGPAKEANTKVSSKQFEKIAEHPEMYDHIAIDIDDLARGKSSEAEAAKGLMELSGGGVDKKEARKLVKQAAENYKIASKDKGWLHDNEDNPKAIAELFTMNPKAFAKKHG